MGNFDTDARDPNTLKKGEVTKKKGIEASRSL
jgi:hypothetical protein